MNCTRWRELASDYIEGALPPDTAAAVRAHLDGCAECRADEVALRTITRELNVLPQVDPPMFFRENVLSAIERQSTRPILSDQPARVAPPSAARPTGSVWTRLFPNIGRLALGTTLAGAAAAAVLYALLAPTHSGNSPMIAEMAPAARFTGVLPGSGEYSDTKAEEEAPRLTVSRSEVSLPGGPAYEFQFKLENAEHGTARFNLIGDTKSYYFNEIKSGQPRSLQVPFAAADGKNTISLHASWTANGQTHSKYLFVPVPVASTNPAVPAQSPQERQSFGLPEMSVTDAARELSSRYGRAVTLEDVPEDQRITLYARDETAASVLRNYLEGQKLRVTASPSGILVAPAEKQASPSATPAAAPSVVR